MRLRIAVDGVDFSTLTSVESLSITQDSTQAVSTAEVRLLQAGSGPGAAARYDSATYDDARYGWSVHEWQEIRIWDEDTGALQFGGFVLGVSEVPEAAHVWFNLSCSDYGILLDRRIITQSWADGTPDSVIFADALRVAPELSAGSLVTQITSLGLIEAKDMRVRDLYDMVCTLTGGEWHVGYSGAVTYYRAGSVAAPFELTDVGANGTTKVKFSLQNHRRDFSQGANRILVLGQVTADGEITGFAEDLASQAAYGLLSVTMPQRSIADVNTAQLLAASELAARAWAQPTVSVSNILTPGLMRGQTLKVTSLQLGLAEVLILRTLNIVIIAPDRTRQPLAGHAVKYTATLGARPPDTVYELRRMQRRPVDTTTPPVATVPPGSIGGGSFAPGWTGIQAVDVLPPLPDVAFSATAVVFLTTDRKLYRRTGNSWTDYINASDIEGQLQTAQLAPGSVVSTTLADGSVISAKIPDAAITGPKVGPLAITTPKLAAGAVTSTVLADGSVITAKIPTGAVQAPQLAASSVTANAVAANAIYAEAIQALAVTAGKLAANSVAAVNIQADAITAGKIAANAVEAGDIAAGAVTANVIAANSIAAIHIQANAVETQHVIANAITTGKIAALNITSDLLAANSVIAGKLAAASVAAANIQAGAVIATTIAAGAVSSDKLNATEIAVGGGGGKPGRFAVYDGAPANIGLIGDMGGGVFGGWFKVFGAGGTGYGDAKIRSNAVGDLGIFNAELAITRGTDTIRMGPSVVNPWTTRLSILMDNGATQKSILSPRALSIYGQWSPGGEPSIQLGLSEYEDAFLTLYGSNLNTYIVMQGQSGSIKCSGSIEVNGHVLMGFTGGTSGVTYTVENVGYVINSAGAFVGPGGVNTAGGVISKGQMQVWAQAICVMNAAGNQYLGYIQADGSMYSVAGITLGGGITCGGNAGLGNPAVGAYPLDVTTPTGQKTLWFMGGICYAVTG